LKPRKKRIPMGYDEDRQRGYSESHKGYVPDDVQNRDAYRIGMQQGQKNQATWANLGKPVASSSSPSASGVSSVSYAPNVSGTAPATGNDSAIEIGFEAFFKYLLVCVGGFIACAISYQIYMGSHEKIGWLSGLIGLGGLSAVVVGGCGLIVNIMYLAFMLLGIGILVAIVFGIGSAILHK